VSSRWQGSSAGPHAGPPPARAGAARWCRSRSRVVALLAALVLLGLGSWVSPAAAFACDCAGLSTARALRQADAVFRGTLRDRDDVGRGGDARTDLRFSVVTVFKGTVHAEQVVATVRGDQARCGLRPEVGSSWVVFAVEGVAGEGDEAVERLVTGLCSGNLPGESTPVLLGPGRPPLAGRSDREEAAVGTDRALTRWLGRLGVGALVVVVLGGAGLALAWRRGPAGPAG